MRIVEVRAVKLNVPRRDGPRTPERRPHWRSLRPPALFLARYPEFKGLPPMPRWPSVWAKVTAEDGTFGLGQTNFGDPVAALIDQHFPLLLVGQDCLATEKLNDILWRGTKAYGTIGLAACAISAVDLALWDLKGKLLGQPVYRLLGGPVRDRQFCYATSDDLDWSQELGFRAFKVSCPAGSWDEDEGLDRIEAHVAAAREAVGASAALAFNPVMPFDAEYAVRVAERLRPFRLRWLEEPLVPEDLEGHAAIRKAITWVPLATGEHHQTRFPFRQLVEQRAVDVLQPEIKSVGGLSECVKIYHIAEAAGIKVILHAGANNPFGLHFSLAMPNVPWAEYFLGSAPGIPLDEVATIPGHRPPHEGYATPSDAPGFGMEIDPAWIEPYFG